MNSQQPRKMESKINNQAEGDTSHSSPAICSAQPHWLRACIARIIAGGSKSGNLIRKQLGALMDKCPTCGSLLVTANLGGKIDTYCEDCGWPDEDFSLPPKWEAYEVSPRGLPTLEHVGQTFKFQAGVIPAQPNFNRKLADVITNQILEGRFDLEEIKLAAPNARHPLFNDVPCDYGVRMRGQVERAIERIKADTDTRRAIVVTARPDDEKPPCIMLIQFLVRDGQVLTVAFMRSWDLLLGFAYDIHLFQALGKKVADALSLPQGDCHVLAGSAHEYVPNAGTEPRRT